MTDFSESLHPRATSGEFAAKRQSRAETVLAATMPGTPVFVGWDHRQQTWHLEDGEKTIDVLAGLTFAEGSSAPVARRQDDGTYRFAYVADPDESGDETAMTVGEITLAANGEILLETGPGTLSYAEAERQLAALRGGVDAPKPTNFPV
jgi:hypothetical protein